MSFNKLMASFDGLAEPVTTSLKSQLLNIERAERESQKMVDSVGSEEQKASKPLTKVDTY